MFRINRATEYALIALTHMGRKDGESVSTAREISDQYGLPYELTAKTLQQLKNSGFLASTQGVRGGYRLTRSLHEMNLGSLVGALEGETAVVDCCSRGDASQCLYETKCEIRFFMTNLSSQLNELLHGMSLGQLVKKKGLGARHEKQEYL